MMINYDSNNKRQRRQLVTLSTSKDVMIQWCFERESENIFLLQAYKLYKPENMADIPIIPAFDANEIMVQTMETNTADSAVGDGRVPYIIAFMMPILNIMHDYYLALQYGET